MKKSLSLLMILILLLGMVACSEKKEEEVDKESIKSEVSEKADSSDASSDIDEDNGDEASVSETSDKENSDEVAEEVEQDDDKNEESDEAFALDASLKGLELLATIPYKTPDKVMTVTESVAADGTTSTSTMYQDGFNTRTESFSEDGGTQIMIYNSEEGIMYSYNVEEASGIMSLDNEEESDFSMGMDMNMDGSMEELPEGDYTMADVFVDPAMGDLEASVEDLNGMQVVHLIVSSDDGMGGNMDIHTWYSVEHGIVMKLEMYMGDALLGSSQVVDYDFDPDIEASMFEKPEGITFMEW